MGASRWIDGERVWDKVVVLDEEAVYTANPKEARIPDVEQRLEAGETAAMVLKDDVTVVPLGAILKVSWNQHDHDIDIVYKPGKEKEDKNIAFAGPEERNAFAAELAECLTGFDSKVVPYGKVRAALGPLGFGGLTAFFTWVLYLAAGDIAEGREAEFSGRNAAVKRILFWGMDVIGPTGVLVVGGIVMALTIAALVMRVKTPPIMHYLKRTKS
jgi:hypothetical protein